MLSLQLSNRYSKYVHKYKSARIHHLHQWNKFGSSVLRACLQSHGPTGQNSELTILDYTVFPRVWCMSGDQEMDPGSVRDMCAWYVCVWPPPRDIDDSENLARILIWVLTTLGLQNTILTQCTSSVQSEYSNAKSQVKLQWLTHLQVRSMPSISAPSFLS